MALSGYIVEKYNCMGGAYTCGRIVDEGKNAGVDIEIIGICDSYVTRDGRYNNGHILEKRDFLVNRYKWGRLKGALSGLAGRTYNETAGFQVYVNKYEQMERIRSEAMDIPRYLLGTVSLPYCLLEEALGTPFVMKGLESSMGREVFLVQGEEDYRRARLQFPGEKEWLFEEYIAASSGRDIRLYSIRGAVVAAMERRAQGDFRANVALGASVRALPVTEAFRRIARDIYDQTRLDFLGIDLLYGEDRPVFCEINVMPGIEGIEKATGVNIAGMLIRTIKGDFGDE